MWKEVAVVKFRTQTLPHLGSSQVPKVRRLVESSNNMCKSTRICINKGGHLKSKLQHTGIWSAAAWPPLHLCYHPAVFFRHLRVIALSLPQVKIRSTIHNFTFWSLKLRTLELRKPGAVCNAVRLGTCLEKRRKLRETSVDIAAEIRNGTPPSPLSMKTGFLQLSWCGCLLGYGMWKGK